MRSRSRLGPVGVAVLASLAVGCEGPPTGEGQAVVAATYQTQGAGGDTASLAGELTEVGGCLAVHSENVGPCDHAGRAPDRSDR
ncbi:MAG: hypothetical protein LBE08_02915 [Bifidobacteriaceae bacterium]|nr:hypothetical protein [Bifidobacteriaceae bacterium]